MRTVNADAVLRPLFSSYFREATHGELSAAIWPEVLRGAIGRDGARADDASAETLLDHLLRGEDVGVHEAEEIDAHFVFDEPSQQYTGQIGKYK